MPTLKPCNCISLSGGNNCTHCKSRMAHHENEKAHQKVVGIRVVTLKELFELHEKRCVYFTRKREQEFVNAVLCLQNGQIRDMK